MEAKTSSFTFEGKGSELFVIILKNFFLTIVTFGIYHFWAKINTQQFFHRNTRFMDQTLEFHGTGKEKFIGFLKGAAIVVVFVILMQLLRLGLGKLISPDIAQIIVGIILYFAVLLIAPLVLVGKRRYLLSRTSWRNVRFLFGARSRHFLFFTIKNVLLIIITLGIYTPWYIVKFRRFFIENSYFGTEKFEFSGKGGDYAMLCLKGILLTFVTFGIYYYWFWAASERFFWNNTSFQGKKFSSTIGGDTLFLTWLINYFTVIFTLGIAIPWAQVRLTKAMINAISVEDGIDFAAIKADFDKSASAFADGLTDAFDALDSISDLVV
jgi:uncharacterized membrane protein YjgN (DUF898 family)